MNRHSLVSSRLAFVPFAAVVVVALAGCPSGNATESSAGDGGRDAQGTDTGIIPGDATPGADASHMPTPPPDFAWYVLDETQGTTAHDSTSNHYDITNLTGVTWNEGASFDGMAGGGSTNVAPSVRVSPITMSAWLTPVARADSADHGGNALVPFPANAFSTDIPDNGGYAIGINVWTDGTPGSALAVEDVDSCAYPAPNPSLCAANASQNAADMTSGPSCTSASHCDQGFVAGVEYFVVVAVAPADGGAMQPAQVYVNGALFDQTVASTLPPATQATPLYLGMCNTALTAYGTRAVFDGRIHDARIYSRQLGAEEIHQMYVNGPTLHAP